MAKTKFHRLLHPRPVYIIGSGSVKENVINFMAASWVSPVSEEPPTVILASDSENYTSELIKKYRQFSIIITDDIDLIWKVGTSSGYHTDKISKFNIRYFEGKELDVPIIENSLGWLEIRVIDMKKIGEVDLFIGEVRYFEGKDLDVYGFKEFWKIPLHKAGKAFAFPSRNLKIIKE